MTTMSGPDCSLAGTRILVVEDKDDGRDLLATALTLKGATVMAVSTAREALPLGRHHSHRLHHAR
jgi:CheY-like chemotaxis protein